MRTPILKSTKEEIRKKLLWLYSDSLDTTEDVLDFDKKYDFFSTDESVVLKFSSNWFTPVKYNAATNSARGKKQNVRLVQNNDGNGQRAWHPVKQESLLRIERAVTTNFPKDLEILGKTPYHLGVEGEKFRVVAATLQKCNSPLVRRTFHFTSNGIVEASERKNDVECGLPFVKQTKSISSAPKFLRIKRFRVIKKDEMGMDKYVPGQEIKIVNNEKTRFLTVKIRPKVSNAINGECPKLKLEAPQSGENSAGMKEEKEKAKATEPNLNLVARTEEVEEETTSEAETIAADHEEEEESKGKEAKQNAQQAKPKEEKIEMFNCGSCGKQFQTYLSCLAHFRSHQRQSCQVCSKKFLTVKMLRDHMKLQHQHQGNSVETTTTAAGSITTATSKFGRTRQVLNVAELRSKYKML